MIKIDIICAISTAVFLSGPSVDAATSPQLEKDIFTDINSSFEQLSNFCAVGNLLFFTATDSLHGSELWKSDGTDAGTLLVKDIGPGPSDGLRTYKNARVVPIPDLTAVGNTLFFIADDGINGSELWKSDGTEEGTFLVKDIRPGLDGGVESYSAISPTYMVTNSRSLTAVGNTLFFNANDGITGPGLWKSDGTAAGTVLVSSIHPSSMTAVGSTLYLAATDGNTGEKLWKSDGTTAGTVLVADIAPSDLTEVGNVVFFTANGGRELWKSDGTAAGTVLVKDIVIYNVNDTQFSGISRGFKNLTAVGNKLFFSVTDATDATQLWTSDDSTGGTFALKSIVPSYLTAVGSTLLFSAFDSTPGSGLWKSDGTAAGTLLVRSSDSSSPSSLTGVGSTLFFSDYDLTTGRELWKSDGSAAGTILVKDIFPGSNSSSPSNLTVVGSTLFFSAYNYFWKSDGTAASTVPLVGNSEKPQNFTVKFTPKGKAESDGYSTRLFGKSLTTNKVGVVRSITITNIGKKPLTGLKISKDGSAAADFIIKGLNKKPLPRGKSITFDVIFRPKTEGSKQAFLHISSSESIENPFDLTLSGTGVRGKKAR